MKRQERQQVQRWLKELHPYANKHYGTRKGGAFPSDQATIRRYFKWCKRHDVAPIDRSSMCLYWGISEAQTIGSINCPPHFTHINVAMLEKQLGRSSTYYLCNSSKAAQRKPHHNKFEDSWWVVAEWITDDKDYLEEHSKLGYSPACEYSYDPVGFHRSHTPGRILKKKIRIVCQSSLFSSYSKQDHVSVIIQPKIIVHPSSHYSTRITTTIEPINSGTLKDVLEAVASVFMANWSHKPRSWSLTTRLQRWVYRSKKFREKLEQSPESRREDARWRRHQRRAKARARS